MGRLAVISDHEGLDFATEASMRLDPPIGEYDLSVAATTACLHLEEDGMEREQVISAMIPGVMKKVQDFLPVGRVFVLSNRPLDELLELMEHNADLELRAASPDYKGAFRSVGRDVTTKESISLQIIATKGDIKAAFNLSVRPLKHYSKPGPAC